MNLILKIFGRQMTLFIKFTNFLKLVKKNTKECMILLYHIIYKENKVMTIIGIFIPIVATIIGTKKNKMFNDFKNNSNDFNMLILMFILYEIFTGIFQNHFMWDHTRIIYKKAEIGLQIAMLKCGIKVSGSDLASYGDLIENITKLRDFIFVPFMIWVTLISFVMTISSIESFNSKIIIIISSSITLVFLIYINIKIV